MITWKHKPSKGAVMQYASLFLFAVILGQIVFSGFIPIKNLAIRATENIAGIIGVAGTVAPNEYNQLATQFEQKDKDLAQRELAISTREQALFSGNDRITLYVLFGMTGFLLILLLLNFYLDWKRGKLIEMATTSHHDELTTRL